MINMAINILDNLKVGDNVVFKDTIEGICPATPAMQIFGGKLVTIKSFSPSDDIEHFLIEEDMHPRVYSKWMIDVSETIRYRAGLQYSKMLYDEMSQEQVDLVNSPPHYTKGKYETIEVIEDMKLGYHLGNAVKYISRAGYKTDDPVTDLKKAVWYLNRKIQVLESEEEVKHGRN